MDEAHRLVLELHDKLAELDLRVWNYRRDMAAEFTRYAEDLLRTVPQEISKTVSKIIAEDMKDYKSLNHESPPPTASGAAGNGGRASAAQPYLTQLNTSYTYGTMHDPEQDSPSGLHEREHDFQGLFTPSYLPLLDHTSRERRPSYTHSPTLSDKGREKEMEAGHYEDTHTRMLGAAPDLQPSQPVRRGTDEFSLNSSSDRSDGQVRRSALRRSSDNSKLQSPRRVRFDVMGEEVLPTSSPQKPDSPIDGVDSYIDDDEADIMESLRLNNLEDSPPQKRKMSTTKALQALTRQPLEDDGTQWVTVSSGPDGEPVVQNPGDPSKNDIKKDNTTNAINNEALGFADDDDDDADTVSDDGMADMPPLSPMRGKRATPVNIPTRPTVPVEDDKPAKTPTPPGMSCFTVDNIEKMQENEEEDLTFLEDDEDNLFRFDESGSKQKSQRQEVQEECDSDSDSGLEMGSQRPSPTDLNFSRSPALDIPSRMTPPQPSSGHKPSVGSYKGHPFNLPIVSEELHAQAASLGAVNSFVGSVTGRSGLDPSDVHSFRESLRAGSFTGAPKSMMERMMMEDFMEAEKEKAAKERAEKEKKR